MRALAKELGQAEGRRIELRELYALAFSRLADRVDAGESVDFKVDRRERVRVSLVLSASLLERLNAQRKRLQLLGTEYAVAALCSILDQAITGHPADVPPAHRPGSVGGQNSDLRADLPRAVSTAAGAAAQANRRSSGARSAG